MKKYNRKTYPSRGKIPRIDYISDFLSDMRSCVVCGDILHRKKGYSGSLESLQNYNIRKTCGRTYVDGKYVASDCYKKLLLGSSNPNYKGIMPKCIVCGKKRSYNNEGKGLCFHCWVKSLKGKCPDHLIMFSFGKGHIPQNSPKTQKRQHGRFSL